MVEEFRDGLDQDHMARTGSLDQFTNMQTEPNADDHQDPAAVQRRLRQTVGRSGLQSRRHCVGAGVVQIVKIRRVDHDAGRARHVGCYLLSGKLGGWAIVQTAMAEIDIDDLAVDVENRLGQLRYAVTHNLRGGRISGGEKQQVFLVQRRFGH